MDREFVEPEFATNLARAASRYWKFSSFEFVRWFENAVFRVTIEGQTGYLRITPSVRRSAVQIACELNILVFLHSKDFGATYPIATQQGDSFVQLQHGENYYFVCVLAECIGTDFMFEPPKDIFQFHFNCGAKMAELHQLLRQVQKTFKIDRFDWTNDRWSRFNELVPSKEHAAWKTYEEMKAWWPTLSRNLEKQLIHGDFTVKNLRYTGVNIHLFDFDGCCEHWIGYEIACFLHYFRQKRSDSGKQIVQKFLEGYSSISAISDSLLESIPQFGKMKLLRSYIVLIEEWGLSNLPPEKELVLESRRRELETAEGWRYAIGA